MISGGTDKSQTPEGKAAEVSSGNNIKPAFPWMKEK